MTDFATMNFDFLHVPHEEYNSALCDDGSTSSTNSRINEPSALLPIVICPTEIDSINVTLEKNQQCACKDCGKLFNSVWYLKQHAVKHSNDRPFKCKFCFKTYKFRSNLYQHKCPDRQKHSINGKRRGGPALSPSSRRVDPNQLLKSRSDSNSYSEEVTTYQPSLSDNEDNDLPITYGLVIHKLEDCPVEQSETNEQLNPVADDLRTTQKRRRDCVRDQPLPQEEIDAYIARNKSKLHTCRKCHLTFPSEASLMRHSGAHSREDMFPYKCGCCRQAFECDQGLRRHSQVHDDVGPRRCERCFGIFRSPLALRRHLDQCRQCCIAPIQNEIMVSVHSPCDASSFIPSESGGVFHFLDDVKKTQGTWCEELPQRFHSTHYRSSVPLDMESLYMFTSNKKCKEDDEDSGFRSRVNSVTHSCSPASSSALSTESSSPKRKISTSDSSDNVGGFTLGGSKSIHFEARYFPFRVWHWSNLRPTAVSIFRAQRQ